MSSAAAGLIPTQPRDWNNNIYTRFGIQPIINCRGVFTYLTASVELPQVRKAAEEASHFFIDLYELHDKVGEYLGKMSGAEYGMITSGSAGSISAAVAGCIAGSDPKNIYQLPDTTGMKGEVIIMGGRSAFDSAIRLTGAKLIVAKTVDDLHTAMTSQTAMIYTTWEDDDRLKQILSMSKPAGVPLMVDMAAGIPPFSNFTRFPKLGVDLFCTSGGKGMMGPQVSGFLCGRKDLITAALYNCAPWEGSICRPMKVGKEEIMGCLAALDYWSKADYDAIGKVWQRSMERVARMVETVPGVTTHIDTPPPTTSDSFATLYINWDEQKFGLTVAQCDLQLRTGNPKIHASTSYNPSGVLARLQDPLKPATRHNQLRILPITMQPGEDLIVGNRVRQILDKARKQAAG